MFVLAEGAAPVVDPGSADGVFSLLWLVIALPALGAVILLIGGPMAKGRLDQITVLGQDFRNGIFERSLPNRLGWAFLTNYNWLLDMSHLNISPEPRAHLHRPPVPAK